MKKWLLQATGLLLGCVLAVTMLGQSGNAQSGNQWRIDYYPNTDWVGAPVYTQYANFADFNWGQGAPGPNLPNQNYSARLNTDVYFYAGVYRFTVLADDDIRLAINNVTYLDTVGQGLPGKTLVVDIPMGQGMAHVSVDFRQFTGPGYLHVSWDYVKQDYFPPSGGAQPPAYVPPPAYAPPPPSAPAPPPSANTLSNKYGDYTPCIQQRIHQANCFHGSGEWNSPNLGSIQMEPQILIWTACKADTDTTQRLYPDKDPVPARCSKTEAGWFPR